MSGYSTVLKIQRLEREITELGFRWGYPRFSSQTDRELISLFPRDEELPIYTRDAELFTGTLEELEVWLRGYKSARHYDQVLFGPKHNKHRATKEQNERNRQLLQQLKSI